MAKTYTENIRVYYKDTDAGGVVYHTRYAEFMEVARTEMFRSSGMSAQEMIEDFNLTCPVVEMSLQFKKPARYDDQLKIKVTAVEASSSRLVLEYSIKNGMGDELVTAQTTNVVLDSDAFTLKKFPPEFLDAFSS